MKKHAVLIQTHKPIDYFIGLAKRHPNVNFYVHFDKKCDASLLALTDNLANLCLLSDRVDVKWGGFSQVAATLKLFKTAFDNHQNHFFHLLSGEDVVLQPFEVIEKQWQQQLNFQTMMTCQIAPQYAYRFIMDSPHADSDWQRKLSGKLMTKFQQGVATIKNYDKQIYFGSQWFSITRDDWEKILPFVDEYSQFFKRKLVPDEHFFQTLIQEKLVSQIGFSNDNKRLIIFDKAVNHGNSPLYLDVPQLEQAKSAGFWFARKVRQDIAMQWLEKN